MLTENQIREEIARLEELQEKYHVQLQRAAETSSTITIMGLCDSINTAEAWINAFEVVLEERKKRLGGNLLA